MQNLKNLSTDEKKAINLAISYLRGVYKKNLVSIVTILVDRKGKIFYGINLKYKKIYKCICAERVVLAKAIENKVKNFNFIVSVKYDKKRDNYYIVNMCGECRQIFYHHRPIKVIIDDQGILKSLPIEKIFLYPYI